MVAFFIYLALNFMIPATYQEWKNCIEVECGLRLTLNFVQARIASFINTTDTGTKKFIELYGMDYYNQVINWFRQAETSFKKTV